MDEHEKKMEQLLEKAAARTIEGNYAVWNSLLTMDSIIITVFTAGLPYLDRNIQLLLVPSILLALVSAGVLIANFRSIRDDFKYQGLLAMGLASKMSEKERRQDTERARRGHDRRVWRERAVEVVTFFQGGLIILVVVFVVFRSHVNAI
jgi:hypothetical protein